MEVKILSKYSDNENYVSYIVKARHSFIFEEKFIAYFPKKLGYLNDKSIVSFYSKISKSQYYNNYNEFNYTRYLNSNNIIASLFVNDYTIIHNGNEKISYRQEIFKYIENNCEINISSLIRAIVFGDKTMLSDDLKSKFNVIGVAYILVVSGTAIYSLKYLISKLTKKLGKKSDILQIILVTMYMMLSNFSISLSRAYIMYIANFIKSKFNLKFSSYFIILVSMLLFFIYNPYIIFNYSFWYTYLAVISIKVIYPKIKSYLNVKLLKIYKVRHRKYITSKFYNFISYIFESVSLTISVQIILFPISLYTCNNIFVLSILSSFIINIFVLLEYILGFIFILIFKVPVISKLVFFLLKYITVIILKIVNIFNLLDFLTIKLNKISFISMICMYIIIFLWVFGYIILFKIKCILKSEKVKYIYYIFIVLNIFIILMDFIIKEYFGFTYFFNVGQGNMAITRYSEVVIVSDIGSSSTNIKSMLLSFLKCYRINKIDYIFVSHMHMDHINGIFSLEEEIKNGDIIVKNVCGTYFSDEIKEFCSRYNINIIELKKSDEMVIGGKIQIDILSPDICQYIYSSDVENSNSMVYSISIKGKKYLYMGDATKETEEFIISSSEGSEFDVFQVGHHGSDTSTSEKFLSKYKFRNAVISSKKKVYGHPSEDVVKRLKNNNINIIMLEKVGGKRFYI